MYTIDKTVLIILIGCATAIALAAIYFDHVVEQKSIDFNQNTEANTINNSNECRLSKKIIKIHRNYIAGFLGFAIIMLLTAQFGRSYNAIYNYLSFASTITSLVLSILAIFVTVHSSSELYKQFNKLEGATDAIESASSQINDILDAIKEADNNLKQTSDKISGQLNTSNIISEQLDNMSKKIFNRIDQNEKMMSDLFSENYSNSTAPVKNQGNSIDRKALLSDTPPYGLYTLYACVLSKVKNKSFLLDDIFNKPTDQMYALGYIVAIRSIGLLEFRERNNDDDPFACIKSDFEKDEIMTKIKKIKNIYDKKVLKRNMNMINKINDFFDEEHLEFK